MSKKTDLVGCTVVVETAHHWTERLEERRLVQRANNIADSIKRHCDDVGNIDVVREYEHSCEFCNARWTEDSPDYNGGCCELDLEKAPPEERAG